MFYVQLYINLYANSLSTLEPQGFLDCTRTTGVGGGGGITLPPISFAAIEYMLIWYGCVAMHVHSVAHTNCGKID